MADHVKPAVLLVEPEGNGCDQLAETLLSAGMSARVVRNHAALLEAVYEQPPQCLILPINMKADTGECLLDSIKADNLYGHLPAIVLVTPEEAAAAQWSRTAADDFLVEPVNPGELVARVQLSVARAQRDINANPLTGLPGNITIMREAERRIEQEESFALAYLDVDNFKSFNDKYGFSRGDEVLRMTGRILVNAMRATASPEAYVGHVGGDDFIFMTPSGIMEAACQEVVRNFDLIVPNFYDEEDRIRGSIDSVDRQGQPRTYPLMTCSIAVVDTATIDNPRLADISARAAQVKKLVKTLDGSVFLVDRRK